MKKIFLGLVLLTSFSALASDKSLSVETIYDGEPKTVFCADYINLNTTPYKEDIVKIVRAISNGTINYELYNKDGITRVCNKII